MNKPIEAGELCYIRGSKIPENNGRVVTTLRKEEHPFEGWGWLVEGSGLKANMWMSNGSLDPTIITVKKGFVTTANLIPIRDNDGETDEISRVREHSGVKDNAKLLETS